MTQKQIKKLLQTLQSRFEKNMQRHPKLEWKKIQEKLEAKPAVFRSLFLMEETEGEPDVIAYDIAQDAYIFCDCSAESPKGRRSLCYDDKALNSRKENKPKSSAMAMASEMGIELLNEEQYFELQKLGDFDLKTSSWLLTEEPLRKLGGAIFGDKRYTRTFIYHNGAESYYAARAFRGRLIV
jgi:hypothetical protein